MTRTVTIAATLLLSATLASAQSPAPAAPAGRGALLYDTHCVGCHGTQVHWRDRKLATDWTSLQTQVKRWQEASALGWSDAEIADVARYLNALHYRFPLPDVRAAL